MCLGLCSGYNCLFCRWLGQCKYAALCGNPLHAISMHELVASRHTFLWMSSSRWSMGEFACLTQALMVFMLLMFCLQECPDVKEKLLDKLAYQAPYGEWGDKCNLCAVWVTVWGTSLRFRMRRWRQACCLRLILAAAPATVKSYAG
jgi:hypothetical protein